MANAPIYAPDPLEGLNKSLMQMAVIRQQQEAQKEQLKIQQQKLKQDQEEMAFRQQQQQMQNAQTQGPQMAAQQMLQQMAAQAVQPMSPMGIPVANHIAEPLPQAVNQFQQLQRTATPDQALAAAPGFAQQAQGEMDDRKTAAFLARMKGSLTPKEYQIMEVGLGLIQRGTPTELVDDLLPETARQAAERLKTLAEAEEITDRAQSNAFAQSHLAEKYGITVGLDKANETLRSMTLADRAFAQARALQNQREDRADARTRMQVDANTKNRMATIEKELRNNFEQSPVVKQASAVAFGYNKIQEAASKTPTGPSDQAIVFAFINMQDNTAARDSERAALQKAGSISEYISARFGRWKEGTTFSDSQRAKILAAAEDMMTAQKGVLSAYTDHYTKLATESGVDPARIMYDPYKDVKAASEDRAAREKLNRAKGIR